MARRQLTFSTYDDVIAELDRLSGGGYQQVGNWTLGQICRHLSYYLRGSLDGFDFMLPWPVRKLVGRALLKRLLAKEAIPDGARTIPQSVFEPDDDDTGAVADAMSLLGRLRDHRGELHPSPLFDHVTPEQWQHLHLIHAAHHLSFLVPHSVRS